MAASEDAIRANLERVRAALAAALARAGRPADSCRLLAVTKNRASAEVAALARAGQADFGENRVQEAARKIPECEALGVGIQAVPSYNINKEFHPKKAGKLGFIVTIDGTVIYHAGDTDHIPEMDSYRCDIALLPVSGTYVMTADEAAQAAAAMRPKVAVPMHYGDIVGSDADAKAFADQLRGTVEVRILKKGG